MLYEKAISIASLKASAVILFLFSCFVLIDKQLYLTGSALAGLGVYFGLIAWQVIRRKNLYYFALLTFFSLSIAYEKGVTMPLIVVILIVFVSFYYLHYHVVEDEH